MLKLRTFWINILEYEIYGKTFRSRRIPSTNVTEYKSMITVNQMIVDYFHHHRNITLAISKVDSSLPPRSFRTTQANLIAPQYLSVKYFNKILILVQL